MSQAAADVQRLSFRRDASPAGRIEFTIARGSEPNIATKAENSKKALEIAVIMKSGFEAANLVGSIRLGLPNDQQIFGV